MRAKDSRTSGATEFLYHIDPELKNTASDFYKAQCGSGGFISGAQLLTNTIDHESGSINSHYSKYKAAQDRAENHIGVGLEAVLGFPGETRAAFEVTTPDF